MTDQKIIDRCTTIFEEKFGVDERKVYLSTAPGRVNIIGEHTDYNHGFVFPCGLNAHMYLLFRPRHDTKVNVYAADLKEMGEADTVTVDFNKKDEIKRFLHYIVGPAAQLAQHSSNNKHPLCGFDAVLSSSIPNGGGVSSSSALCVASTAAFRKTNEHFLKDLTEQQFLMAVCEGEWAWSGVRGGIMDQYASINAQAGCAFILDCRTSEIHPKFGQIELPNNLVLIVANTNVKHDLVGTPYNDRRAACERAAAAIAKEYPDKKITHLRDTNMDMLNATKGHMDPEAHKRAVHVIDEDVRTISAGEAIIRGDLTTLGKLVNGSHDSLRDLYEVSCDELDIMVNIARNCDGVYGARMMGGGFGGCSIVLAKPESVTSVISTLNKEYKKQTGLDASILATTPGPGSALKQVQFSQHKAN